MLCVILITQTFRKNREKRINTFKDWQRGKKRATARTNIHLLDFTLKLCLWRVWAEGAGADCEGSGRPVRLTHALRVGYTGAFPP